MLWRHMWPCNEILSTTQKRGKNKQTQTIVSMKGLHMYMDFDLVLSNWCSYPGTSTSTPGWTCHLYCHEKHYFLRSFIIATSLYSYLRGSLVIIGLMALDFTYSLHTYTLDFTYSLYTYFTFSLYIITITKLP